VVFNILPQAMPKESFPHSLYGFRHTKVACRGSNMKGVQHFRDKTFWQAKLLVSFLARLFILPAPEHQTTRDK